MTRWWGRLSYDMPQFRDENGEVWVWDPTSHTYVKGEGEEQNFRSRSTGGDNDLFDPATVSEKSGNPMFEGFMASTDACPHCQMPLNGHSACNSCGWSQVDFRNPPPQPVHNDGMPDRVERPNLERVDHSFPSMLSSYKYAWDDDEDDQWYLDQGVGRQEIGKFIVDTNGALHYEAGAHAFHEQIIERDGLTQNTMGALGSVYSDGNAEVQLVYGNFPVNDQQLSQELSSVFGQQITVTNSFAQAQQTEPRAQKDTFDVIKITEGSTLGPTPVRGYAWVFERPNGVEFDPKSMIFCCIHVQPEHDSYARPARGIITATGGASSHAVVLAKTYGKTVRYAIGPSEYKKIETGDFVSIEQDEVQVWGDFSKLVSDKRKKIQDYYTEPLTGSPQAPQSGLHEHMRRQLLPLPQRLMRRNQMTIPANKTTFDHILDEEQWRLANEASLDSCPECGDPLSEAKGEKVCHSCGHRQKIIETVVSSYGISQHRMAFAELLPMAAEALMGGEAAAAPAMTTVEDSAGLLNGASGATPQGAGKLMSQALAFGDDIPGMTSGLSQQQQQGPDASNAGVVAKTAGDVGIATPNRGTKDNPAEKETQSFSEEHGDSPDLLKDVDGIGGPNQGDERDGTDEPHGVDQETALRAFHLNLPLIMEYADDPNKNGSEHPLIVAIDEMLESAFPGYKDGHDQSNATAPEDIFEETGKGDEDAEDTGSDKEQSDNKDKADSAKESNFGYGLQPEQMVPGMGQPCPICGDTTGTCPHSAHLQQGQQQAGVPQPVGPTGQPAMMSGPGSATRQKVVTHKVASDLAQDTAGPQEAAGEAADGFSDWVDDAWGHHPSKKDQSSAVQAKYEIVAFGPEALGGDDDFEDYQDPSLSCPTCGGPGVPMGALGNRMHYRCRNCGIDFSENDVGIGAGGGPVQPGPDGSAAELGQPAPHQQMWSHAASADVTNADFLFYAADDGDEITNHVEYHDHSKPGVHDWLDDNGQPLEEGMDYELRSQSYDIPDKITIDKIYPDKIIYTLHSQDMDYQDSLHKQDIETEGLTFAPEQSPVDSTNQFPEQNAANPGFHDGAPQVDDLSQPSTTVSKAAGIQFPPCPNCGQMAGFENYPFANGYLWCNNRACQHLITPEDLAGRLNGMKAVHDAEISSLPETEHPLGPHMGSIEYFDPDQYGGSFSGDNPDSRDWINTSSATGGVDVDPFILAKLAGKDYSPREQREFIDESGEARNLDKLDLRNTHYEEEELDVAFNW